MKSTKKLLMATLMLVVAFVAATSATFAWFTMRQEATVTDIQLEAASVGEDLQIAKEGETTGTPGAYGYSVNLGDIYGKLEPVTFDATAKGMYKLALDNDNNDTKFVFKYVEANDNILDRTSESAGLETYYADSYLAFDLWFRTTNTAVNTLNFDVSSVFAANAADGASAEEVAAANAVLNTLRIMFIVGDDFDDFQPWTLEGDPGSEVLTRTATSTLIYEPFKTGEGTYGEGSYFTKASGYIAEEAFNFTGVTVGTDPELPYSPFTGLTGFDNHGTTILNTAGETAYALNATFKEKAEYLTEKVDTTTVAEGTVLSIGALTYEEDVRVKVVIWIEGWDGDTVNTAALGNFIAGLKFTASTVE